MFSITANSSTTNPEVISPAALTAQREAAQRAKAIYHSSKVQTLRALGQFLSKDGGRYTARQLAEATGLTSGEVANQLGWDGYCNAAAEAGLQGHTFTEQIKVTRRYVEVDEAGRIMDGIIHEHHERITVYGAHGVK